MRKPPAREQLSENMDVFKVIKGRRSIRRYTKDPVSLDLVKKILDAADGLPQRVTDNPGVS